MPATTTEQSTGLADLGFGDIGQHHGHRDQNGAGQHHVGDGVFHRRIEILVGEHILVVLQADPAGAGAGDLLEAHHDGGDQGVGKEDQEGDDKRSHKYIRRNLLGIQQLPVQRYEHRDQRDPGQHDEGAVAQGPESQTLHGAVGLTFFQMPEDVGGKIPAVVVIPVKLNGFPLEREE